VERGVCPIAELYLLLLTLVSSFTVVVGFQQNPSLKLKHLGHVTSSVTLLGFTVYIFPYMVNLNQPSISHGCQDIESQSPITLVFWGDVTLSAT